MVIRHAIPGGYSIISLLDAHEPRPRLTPASAIALSGAVLLHLAGADCWTPLFDPARFSPDPSA